MRTEETSQRIALAEGRFAQSVAMNQKREIFFEECATLNPRLPIYQSPTRVRSGMNTGE
jgi:hypothetical protein